MNTSTRSVALTALFVLSLGAGWVLFAAASGHGAEPLATSGESRQVALTRGENGSTRNPDAATALADEPLARYQAELLELAFDTATALPMNPHAKTRSRLQEEVVAASLELGQPRRALGYVEQIGDWRRAAAYADLASYCARHGRAEQAEPLLEIARRLCEAAESENADPAPGEGPRSWRTDRIRAKIAAAYVRLGDAEKSAAIGVDVADSEAGHVRRVEAELLPAKDFEGELVALDALVATGSFDQVRNALDAYARLYERFYADEYRRSRAEERLRASWTKMPILIRVEGLVDLADVALEHEDPSRALGLVDDAQELVETHPWPAEERVPLAARLARLRHLAGDPERARREADHLHANWSVEREQIVDIERSEALRPLAEAYHAMGDARAAADVYRRVVEEGVANPNARPRAEDLTATCLSMALSAVEPDDEMWKRLRVVRSELKSPW